MSRVKGGILPGDPGYMENNDWMADIEPRDIENQRLIERNIELERKNAQPHHHQPQPANNIVERHHYNLLPNFDPLRSPFARAYFDYPNPRESAKDEEIRKLRNENQRLANVSQSKNRKSRSRSRTRSRPKPRSKSKPKSKK